MEKSRKKGAMELSMNTIVIVVIGIVILTLGLRWIYGIFGGLEDQRTQLMEATQQQIQETFKESNYALNLLTEKVEIEQNDLKVVGVGVKNIYSESHTYRYLIEAVSYPAGIQPNQALAWVNWEKTSFTLQSGGMYPDVIALEPKNIPLGMYRFRVKLQCVDAGCEDDSRPFIVIVTSK